MAFGLEVVASSTRHRLLSSRRVSDLGFRVGVVVVSINWVFTYPHMYIYVCEHMYTPKKIP